MHLQKVLIIFSVVCVLTGCTNPYGKYYRSDSHNVGAEILPPSGEPRIASLSSNPRQDVLAMYEQGYALIGESAFVGRMQNQDGALSQAKKVGAEVVLVGSRYRNTVSGAMPITTPVTTTSYSNGIANAYGSGGFATGTYSGTTTTFGSQTQYIPYSVDKYDQGALFFAPLARTGFGILFGLPTNEQKQNAGTNRLIVVMAVRRESPAFNADIFPGDLLMSVDGKSVYDVTSFREAIAGASEKPVKFILLRQRKHITKHIQIPESW